MIRKLRYLMIVLLSLLNTIPSYSFGFFGTEVSGSLDEATEQLKSIGFSPVMVIPKTGENAGKEVIFGNESFRLLRGNILGFPVTLDISTGGKDVVTYAEIEYRNSDKTSKDIFGNELFKYLNDKYGEPQPLIIKEILSENELSDYQKSFDGDAPDLFGMWKFKDLMILYSIYFNTGIVKCSFYNK